MQCIKKGLDEQDIEKIEELVDKIDLKRFGYIVPGDLNEFIEEYEGRDI